MCTVQKKSEMFDAFISYDGESTLCCQKGRRETPDPTMQMSWLQRNQHKILL